MDDEDLDAAVLVDDAHGAFGAEPGDAQDPLAGVDARVPDDVDAGALAAYCLMLGDDALVMSQRVAQWTSRAPDLEEDIALANIALDLLGQARLLLARAALADPTLVPDLADSPAPGEDRLAYFRDAHEFRNVCLVERPNGDFAEAVARILVFATWRYELCTRLAASRDPVLAAVAAQGAKELAYHRDFAARWFLTLARGTAESRRRLLSAWHSLVIASAELFTAHPIEAQLAATGVAVNPSTTVAAISEVLAEVCAASEVAWDPPESEPESWVASGRSGQHTAAMGDLLAEMQSVARAHPRGRW